MKRILISGLVVALVIAFGVWKYVFRKAENSVASKKAELVITADSLFSAYENDEAGSNTLFLDKVLLVEGRVGEITSTDTSYTFFLKKEGESNGIQCGFPVKPEQAGTIKVGDMLKVKGLCTGYMFDVVLNMCVIEE
jgi:hypothetical protein